MLKDSQNGNPKWIHGSENRIQRIKNIKDFGGDVISREILICGESGKNKT